MRIAMAAVVSAALASVAGVPGARACSSMWMGAFETDPAEVGVDVEAPGPVTDVVVRIKRGHGVRYDGCGGGSSDSCDDIGWIELVFTVPADDRTAPDAFGYRVTRVEGDAPDFVAPYLDGPFRAALRLVDGRTGFSLDWIDGDTDDQEPIDMVLQVRVVDAAGNEGPPVDVAVSDPGSGGCQAGRSGSSLVAPLVLVLLAIAVRRRRPARSR